MDRYQRTSGRYRKKKTSEVPHILLFYVLPFIVVNLFIFYCAVTKPKAAITVEDTKDYLSTEVVLTLDSFFPTRSVTITMDGETLELTREKRAYTAVVNKNGSIEASIVNLNGMPLTLFEHVNVLDDNPPAFESTDIQDGIVTLTISDSQSGVDFDSIYALNSLEEQIAPISVNRSTNTISYEMDSAGLRVFAKDKAGNEVQGTFTSHRENGVETLEGGADETEDGVSVAGDDTSATAGDDTSATAGETAAATTAAETEITIE